MNVWINDIKPNYLGKVSNRTVIFFFQYWFCLLLFYFQDSSYDQLSTLSCSVFTWYLKNSQCCFSGFFCVFSSGKCYLFRSVLLLLYFLLNFLHWLFFTGFILFGKFVTCFVSQTQLIHQMFHTNIYNDPTVLELYSFILSAIVFDHTFSVCVCVWVYVCTHMCYTSIIECWVLKKQ